MTAGAGDWLNVRDFSAGSWIVYLREMDSTGPTLLWSDELTRTWMAAKLLIAGDWQPLTFRIPTGAHLLR